MSSKLQELADKFEAKLAASKIRTIAKPSEEELRSAVHAIRKWCEYVKFRKAELQQEGAPPTGYLVELIDELEKANAGASDALGLIRSLFDL